MLGALVASHAAATVLPIVPFPASVEAATGAPVRLATGARILVPRGDVSALRTARWLASLARQSRGLGLAPTTRGGASARVVLRRRAGPADSEAYDLTVAHGQIVISASSDAGLLYGAVTLWQLMSAEEGRGPVSLAPVHVADQPRFAWRGMLLDSARHFQSPGFIERALDWMALHKLNVLQWHLTDDQGWRLPIAGYPRLTGVGAWRIPASVGAPPRDPRTGRPPLYGGVYAPGEIRAIVAHARARNITIVPEIEMPGHAVAALLAYPELSAGPPPPRSVQSDWGILPYAYGVDEHVFAFLDQVLGQVIALFPSRIIAIGGDEVPLDIWKASPAVQARMKALGIADETGLQNYFIRRIEAYLAAHGRRAIGWEEILKGGPLPPGAIVASWQGAASALTAARAGHDVVIAIAPTLYFDNRQGVLPSEPPGRGTVVSLKNVYELDPGAPPLPAPGPVSAASPPAAAFSSADRAHILGLQGNMWSEHIRTDDRMAMMMFPRAAAVAEAGWTPQSERAWPDFLARMPAEFARFRSVGLAEDSSVFAVEIAAEPAGAAAARITLANQTGYGQIRYSLTGAEPDAASPVYSEPWSVPLPSRIAAASFDGSRRISPVVRESLDAQSIRRRVSQQLDLCPGGLPLGLEGSAPAGQPRAVMLVEVMNLCWMWRDVDLAGVRGVKLEVGAIPFNLQIGADLARIVRRPSTHSGMEMQVRLDGCEGELLTALPLGPARPGLSELSAALPPRPGRHSLCFAVAGDSTDPIWGLNAVQLVAGKGS
ncbi:MAG TPA: family 20 glycosylhydrolase [Caulobacteraceae bacterium]|nr:family 20 glycosylhydrolase [Caulobacteraceae bacterium]